MKRYLLLILVLFLVVGCSDSEIVPEEVDIVDDYHTEEPVEPEVVVEDVEEPEVEKKPSVDEKRIEAIKLKSEVSDKYKEIRRANADIEGKHPNDIAEDVEFTTAAFDVLKQGDIELENGNSEEAIKYYNQAKDLLNKV